MTTQKTFIKGQNPRSSWLEEEDARLTQLVGIMGERNWALIAQELPGRVGKQCRERWRNHLNPNIRHDSFTEEEDQTIVRLVQEIGTRWARISELMEGRTENAIKNRYYCFLKRQVDCRPKKKAKISHPTDETTSPVSVGVASTSDSDQENCPSDASTDTSVKTSNPDPVALPLPAPRVVKSSVSSPKRSLLVRHKNTGSPRRQLRTGFGSSVVGSLDPVAVPSVQPHPPKATPSRGLAISDLICEDQDDALWSAAVALCTLRAQ